VCVDVASDVLTGSSVVAVASVGGEDVDATKVTSAGAKS